METNKKQHAILYLDKNGFYFYEVGLSSVVSLAFLATSVKDMDVINGANIVTQIGSFIEQYQIPPSLVTIIVSPNITFEKDFFDLISDTLEEKIKKFIDTIPFESIMAKQYPIEKGVKVIGWNEELYLELKSSFEKYSFILDAVIPYQLLGSDQALIQNFTQDNATQLLRRIDRLKQFSMLTVQKEKLPTSSDQHDKKDTKPKKKNVRLYAMAITFVVLFAILGYMLLKR